MEETKVPQKDVTRALQSLACGKSSQRVLVKTPKSKEISSSDLFQVSFLKLIEYKMYYICGFAMLNSNFLF